MGIRSCHQWRHKAMGLVASCKNKKKNKPCTTSYCKNCLLNRYEGRRSDSFGGLALSEVQRHLQFQLLQRKKQGHQPTGRLVHTAKATGVSSVSELLCVKGLENYEPAVALPKQWGKENSITENSNSNLRLPLPSNLDEKSKKD
ncbi:hypothetical protein RHMOL_Rhmol12G0096400 [Rhododendron molle]|uniref:Uncharacterized protein n=4 Tax=Rhododendron molle TaxID=49168 RepID=A0ACC0LHB5_RHOML|nr:hypothetical protein RHMOL_Rhmol12G0096400 [Rhododendron molle]KAI8527713.1 hypothetical protein RHMOL_Rhmol12G0096400 [Rhododendron molle]KAI8527714.1 hypothetical protein RHMOL_Rhmol12G0096400 [Rhododendron molle]KAI8527715.1 hypothetical protein RHMOL_Rhmol12G0096400 [Rhododendron molle]